MITLVQIEGKLFTFEYDPTVNTVESFCMEKCKSIMPYVENIPFSECLLVSTKMLEMAMSTGYYNVR